MGAVGIQHANSFLPKILHTAANFVSSVQNSKLVVSLKPAAQKAIHGMTSKIIWGEDVNDKVGLIDYIDFNT